jgi:hypothetical protein
MSTPPSYEPPTTQQPPLTAQMPTQRQAPPEPPTRTPTPGKPRTALKVTLGTVAGLVVGLIIGAAGKAQPANSAAAAAPPTVYATAPATAPQVETVTVAPPPPPPPPGPLTSFSDGTYEVGSDIVPGKYKTPGPAASGDISSSCYMEVGNGTGRVGGIDQNDNLTGPGVVTLKAGKVFKISGGCTWNKVG